MRNPRGMCMLYENENENEFMECAKRFSFIFCLV